MTVEPRFEPITFPITRIVVPQSRVKIIKKQKWQHPKVAKLGKETVKRKEEKNEWTEYHETFQQL